jgi:hypothetical protein
MRLSRVSSVQRVDHWSSKTVAVFCGLLSLVLAVPAVAETPDAKNFVTHLTGAEEVPDRKCPRKGQAMFQLSKDGLQLSYRLIDAEIFRAERFAAR